MSEYYQKTKEEAINELNTSIENGLSEKEAKELEILMIDVFNTQAPNGYNITQGGEGTVGFFPSESTRREMSKSRRGERNGMYGKQHGTETKEKMRKRALERTPVTGDCKSRPGNTNGMAISVLVDGKEYGCIKDAALEMGCHPETLRRKFRRYRETNQWPDNWACL